MNKKISGKRVAVYARVSTLDKGQDPETQLMELREYANSRKFTVTHELVDYASGRKEDRTCYQTLFELVRKRQVDIVLVWRYDRFARSTQALVNALVEFRDLGVDFISYRENIDTTTPQGKMVFTIMASLAEFESALISERVKAGMARARKAGKQIGRSKTPTSTQKRIRQLRSRGMTVRAIAEKLGISTGTVFNYLVE